MCHLEYKYNTKKKLWKKVKSRSDKHMGGCHFATFPRSDKAELTNKIISPSINAINHKNYPKIITCHFHIHKHCNLSWITQLSANIIKIITQNVFGSTIWNGIPLTLRSLRKNDFTKKITTLLFDILISEDSYLETDEIIHRINHFVKWYCDLHLE